MLASGNKTHDADNEVTIIAFFISLANVFNRWGTSHVAVLADYTQVYVRLTRTIASSQWIEIASLVHNGCMS